MLQKDLDDVTDWAERWQMQFNVFKCEVVHYGKGSIDYNYSMQYQPIDEVKSEKDLGVTVSNDLKAAAHCKEVYAKANHMLGMISRTIKDRNPKTMTSLYKSLVRPHLEYSSLV